MKRYYRIFGIICGVFMLFFLGMYVADPMQLFHKKWFGGKDMIFKRMYVQDAGIINSLDFDSVIFGSSMLENTSAKEASSLLGGNFFNISMSGSDFDERAVVLNHLLANRDVEKILYSMDASFLKMGKADGKFGSYAYLYDDSRLNDMKLYLFDAYYYRCIFTLFLSDECMGDTHDMDRPAAWKDIRTHKERFGGLKNWFADSDNKKIKTESLMILTAEKELNKNAVQYNPKKTYLKKIHKYIDENVLKFAKQNPDTEFVLILPPASMLNNAIRAQTQPNIFYYYTETVKYLVARANKIDNVRIYGFDNIGYSQDIANYKDLTHYNHDMNSLMLKYIAEERGLLTDKNIDSYIRELTEAALKYDIRAVARQIKVYQAETNSRIMAEYYENH